MRQPVEQPMIRLRGHKALHGNREQGTGNREQGTGNREQGTGAHSERGRPFRQPTHLHSAPQGKPAHGPSSLLPGNRAFAQAPGAAQGCRGRRTSTRSAPRDNRISSAP
ncbi:hypothetical protein C5U62_28115 [Pseudomonas protegens]|uniref:Uncharacterized protein n=1 Tax=Pseudomonas protegens TaxID=380021 RepID=A0A2T6GDU7_9PSED|nr:hypothetical protein C5U62_28115 [Pseudomonas protegens]